MNKEQVLGIIRHTFTFIGGLVVLKGYIDENTVSEIMGSLMTLIGFVWSIAEKKDIKSDEE